MKLIRILILLFFTVSLANAGSLENIKHESETAAKGILDSKLKDNFTLNKSTEVQGMLGYEKNAHIEGQGLPLEQAEGFGSAKRQEIHKDGTDYKCDKKQCEVGHSFSTKAALERETSVEAAGFVRDENGQIKNNKGYMDKALETVKNTKNKFDFISGSYMDCTPDKEVEHSKTEEICEEYYDIKEKSCFARRIVEIDPKYTYVCNKKREVKEKTCEQILKLTCKEWEDGIVFISPERIAGRKLNSFDGDSMVAIHTELSELGLNPFQKPLPTCKYLIPSVIKPHETWGIPELSKLKTIVVLNGQVIANKWLYGDKQDLRRYFKPKNNVYEVEIGITACFREEFTFDYIERMTCKAFEENWEEKCN